MRRQRPQRILSLLGTSLPLPEHRATVASETIPRLCAAGPEGGPPEYTAPRLSPAGRAREWWPMAARDKNIRVASTRIAALVRHRTPDDPDVIEAARDLCAAQLDEHVRRVVDSFP